MIRQHFALFRAYQNPSLMVMSSDFQFVVDEFVNIGNEYPVASFEAFKEDTCEWIPLFEMQYDFVHPTKVGLKYKDALCAMGLDEWFEE